MTEGAVAALAVLVWLQIKHLFCDFFFQTPRQIEMKGVYGHPAGLSHAAQHAVASIPVFLLMPVSAVVAAAIVVAEFVTHYHVDWIKAVIGDRKGWTVRDKEYWRGLGSDQFLHQMTYLAICALLIWLRS
ncbi:DUF3307 domain-containing protein [Kaistia geumhonensis]|uniref:DUF3307 domain-containing protein n=1 Tax=Kaistia geumhonensis TaxID=410839 RepID=A0ABU0M3X3_9HYPH|nr:DUF3307 domain-containing protein [Kaistia geumhonensis]MCX5479131.1 DUF3307 domain-containing protein [Kaistia geumhonensis]MDQ0515649.1 hypothetical protein [Kaistia geumhonensis]